MDVVTLEIAKKLSRRKWNKGQTKKMYQKETNCSVYNLKDNHKHAFCSYDAPNLSELQEVAEVFKITHVFGGYDNVNDFANKLLSIFKTDKLYFNSTVELLIYKNILK